MPQSQSNGLRISADEVKDRFDSFLVDQYADEVAEFERKFPKQKRFVFDWSDLVVYDSTLAREYAGQPTKYQRLLNEALQFSDAHNGICLTHAWACPQGAHIREQAHTLRGGHIGSLVQVPVRIEELDAADTRPRIGVYRCQKCGDINTVREGAGEVREPSFCTQCDRQRVSFSLEPKSSHFVSYQEGAALGAGHLLYSGIAPEHLSLELYGPVVDSVAAGDWVLCTGVLSVDVEDGEVGDMRLVGLAAEDIEEDELESYAEGNDDDYRHRTIEPSHFDVFQSTSVSLTEAHLKAFTTHVESILEMHDHEEMTEEDVKTKIVTPLIELLGWDIYGPNVRMEHRVNQLNTTGETAADYVLLADDVPKICIEAKRLTKPVAQSAAQQLRNYMKYSGAELGFVTNGRTYRFLRKPPNQDPEYLSEFTVELLSHNLDVVANYTEEAVTD